MSLPAMILASASPRRADLLRQIGLEFLVLPGQVDEIRAAYLSPHELAQINAYRKARVVAKKHPDMLVLGADTIVCLGLEVFGKPASRQQAEEMLARLEGRTHEVVTGVCLIHLRSHRESLFAASTSVTFRPLDGPAIQRYLERVSPLDKAGAYAIQEHGDLIVHEISGSFSNVVGLPIERLQAELDEWRDSHGSR